jgi:Rieske Fe-S protein
MEENMQSRREFLKLFGEGLAGIAIIGFVAPIINSCSSSVNAGADVAAFNITVDVSSLTSNNQGLRTNTPDGHTLLVVRKSQTDYTTLLLVCTHEGCSGDSLQQSGTTITCSCHGAQFNLSGAVTHGPASTNLTTYPTAYDASTKKVTIHS